MKPPRRSSSYIIRNRYSYCFRLVVPKDLQKFVEKKELRYTLKTGYIGLAKSKARLLAGQMQHFFRELRRIIKMGELTDEQIQEMVKKYFRNYSEGLEMMRAEAGPFGKGDTFQTINQITQSVCKQAKKDLTDCNYFDYWVFASQILKNEGIEVEKGSLIHNKICRELIKGMIKFGEIEDRRHNGDYSDDLKAIFPLTSDKKAEMPPSESPKDVIPITLKQLIDNYFSEMIKSVQWAESTQKEYTTSYNLFIDFLGADRQVHTIGDQDMLGKVLLNFQLYLPHLGKATLCGEIQEMVPRAYH